jgi:hypothetical protein
MHLAHEVCNIDECSGVMSATVLTISVGEAKGKSDQVGAMANLSFRSVGQISRNACGQLMSLQPEEVEFLFWLSTCAFALIKQILWRGVVPSRFSFEGRRN